MSHELRIDPDRLWARLMEMAKLGATERGGVRRLALSDEDGEARGLFRRWCDELGLDVSVDAMGNMFARRAGRRDLPPVLIGSHLDSQPSGGRFDGALGVLAALAVVETLNDHAVETEAPIAVVAWTNEEGARFAPAMLGSGVFASVFSLDYGLTRADRDGVTVGDALERIGYGGPVPMGHTVGASVELHIEQGPVLEARDLQIGIVTAVQGTRWFHVHFDGAEAHAGPTPMESRRDPIRAAAASMHELFRIVTTEFGPSGRLTFGEIDAEPASINTVPGHIRLTVDMRHPDDDQLDAMERALRFVIEDEARRVRVDASVERIWKSEPVAFDSRCVAAVRAAAEALSYRATEIVSGAGHDSVYLSRIAPTGMIFVPCRDGVSHNEAESIEPEQAEAGANVLLHAALMLAAGPVE